jgi:predicted alpha-1,2-mannosidase
MAKKMGEDSLANKYFKQSYRYKNVFDKEINLMRGKNKDGSFQTPFNPLKWGDAFTEGNSLHYTWSVFHDFNGLINLMGGKKEFIKQLNSVFDTPPKFDASYYGRIIHEIREMQVVNMGNYAHGNQPIQHMAYLYNYAGKPYITQEKIRLILTKLYKPTPDGYCGDEDNGQTSAWYVFSALGFYPVTPGINQYVIGTPLFKKSTLHLNNGKTFAISSKNNSKNNFYIQSAKLNDKNYKNTFINFEDIQRGGSFKFNLGNTPNKQWGYNYSNAPFSLSTF